MPQSDLTELKLTRMQQRIWYLQNCDLLGNLSADQLASLERKCQLKKFAKGSPIYLPSESADSVLLVASGLAKICHLTLEGRSSTIAFVKEGEIFGELSLLDAEVRGEYVEAIEPSTLIRIPRDAIQLLMERDLHFALRLTKYIGLRRRKIELRLRALLFTSNQHRLTHLLLDLAEQFGVQVEEGIQLGLRLSHQEMANLIGTTRETVTLLLGKMKSEGLITGHRQSVILCDMTRLAQSIGRD